MFSNTILILQICKMCLLSWRLGWYSDDEVNGEGKDTDSHNCIPSESLEFLFVRWVVVEILTDWCMHLSQSYFIKTSLYHL